MIINRRWSSRLRFPDRYRPNNPTIPAKPVNPSVPSRRAARVAAGFVSSAQPTATMRQHLVQTIRVRASCGIPLGEHEKGWPLGERRSRKQHRADHVVFCRELDF